MDKYSRLQNSTLVSENTRKNDVGKSSRGRAARKRENRQVSDNPKTPLPQKSKAFIDKRPKPRSFGYDRTKEKVAEEDHTIYHDERPKKVNLNHLLNFSYTPRGQNYLTAATKSRHHYPGKVKFNKEQFLQANCQFVVTAGQDYTCHDTDPDILVNWDFVELINVTTTEEPSCPICLFPPTPAKITRCGHIYCWPCILHYLSLDDKSWRKCPICFEAIHSKHLKSVKIRVVKDYKVGDEITMQLMMKQRGSTHITPVSRASYRSEQNLIFNEDIDELIVKNQELNLFDKDVKPDYGEGAACASDTGILDEGNQPPVNAPKSPVAAQKFNEQAGMYEFLIEGKASPTVCGLGLASSSQVMPGDDSMHRKLVIASSDDIRRNVLSVEKETLHFLLQTELEASEVCFVESALVLLEERIKEYDDKAGICSTAAPVQLPTEISDCDKPADKILYLYQASDGQHIYLNSVNVHCLVTEYGSMENSPLTLTAEIIEIEQHVMTEVIRKRWRYLNHLPITCEFKTMELRLVPPTVSVDTLKLHHNELEKRRHHRQRRFRDESRHRRRVQRDEDRKRGIYPAMNVRISSHRQFPEYRNDIQDTQCDSGTSSPASISAAPSPVITPFGSPGINTLDAYRDNEPSVQDMTILGTSLSPKRPSFAEMLKNCGATAPAWPTLASSPPEVLPSPPRSDSDESLHVPSYQRAFDDAFQAAIDNFNINEATGSTKKKKKQKSQLLFTTSVRRGNHM